jgi:hypothetical protein
VKAVDESSESESESSSSWAHASASALAMRLTRKAWYSASAAWCRAVGVRRRGQKERWIEKLPIQVCAIKI